MIKEQPFLFADTNHSTGVTKWNFNKIAKMLNISYIMCFIQFLLFVNERDIAIQIYSLFIFSLIRFIEQQFTILHSNTNQGKHELSERIRSMRLACLTFD